MIFQIVPAQNVMTLQECIDYALEHNTDLRIARATTQLQEVSVRENKAAWLPSMSANLSEGVTWRPFADDKKSTVNGSYGVNANWTIWDGNTRQLNIKSAEIDAKRSQLN